MKAASARSPTASALALDANRVDRRWLMGLRSAEYWYRNYVDSNSRGQCRDFAMVLPTSIARTAFDSLHSKLSSINAGWLDDKKSDDDDNITRSDGRHNNNNRIRCDELDGIEEEDTNFIDGNLGSYCKLLRRIGNSTTTTVDSRHDTTNDATTREEKKNMTRRRRQTPLINAFYAARIAVMTHIIERWIDNVVVDVSTKRKNADDDSNNDDYRINIVILGCGMDACGIWCKEILLNKLSASSSPSNNAHRPKVMVYELDAKENCLLKRHALITSGLIHESPCTNTATVDFENVKMVENDTLLDDCYASPVTKKESFRTVCKGKILLDNAVSDAKYDQNDNNSDDEDDYFLIAVDLRDTLPSPSHHGVDNAAKNNNSKSILSGVFQHIGLDFTTQPTLVISELVLAYLGHDGGDAILDSISSDVIFGGAAANNANNNNMFVCLEPIFSSNDKEGGGSSDYVNVECNRNEMMLSIEESYARDYGRQFLGKLKRGNSRHHNSASQKMFNDGNDDLSMMSSSWLYPLGSNSKSVHLRLLRCGFPSSGICYAPMSRAVANVARYRRSMGAVNFLRAKEPFDEHAALILNLNCYGVVCAFSSASFDSLNRLVVEDDLENIRSEQIQRDICPWLNSNRVRVSSSDFNIRPIASALDDDQVRDLYTRLYSHLFDSYPSIRKMVKSALKSDLGLVETHIELESTIRNCYKLKGGDFWIASDNDGRVVGCIGLCLREEKRRPFDEKSQIVSSLEPTNNGCLEYEIQRLCVDEQYRGKGVGRSLLSNVEQWVRNQHEPTTVSKSVTYVAVNIKAVTPDCLTAANKLYDSVAYVKEETFHSGNIIMNVYYKTIQLQ